MASASEETAVSIASSEGTMFAVETRPAAAAPGITGITVVILPGLVAPFATHRDALWVRGARRLAGRGHRVLRIDWHGVGDSTGVVTERTPAEPFAADGLAAARWAAATGDAVVLYGACFGARSAAATATRVDGIRAVVLLSPPPVDVETQGQLREQQRLRQMGLREWARWAAGRYPPSTLLHDRRSRRMLARQAAARLRHAFGRSAGPATVSPAFLADLTALVERRVPVLLVYGENDDMSDVVRDAMAGGLGAVVQRPDSTIDLRFLPGVVHSFADRAGQDDIMSVAESWLDARA
ncbi:MAG: hydrolase of the alpha/beta superfamily [Acidimicrobiales bacterium]|jgi:pimeloyl-ACP methyl ester carboxylesterase|nr:hydrolase of the alpha/beta superfamily [Acidimicrobiales bacterium]